MNGSAWDVNILLKMSILRASVILDHYKKNVNYFIIWTSIASLCCSYQLYYFHLSFKILLSANILN